MGKVQRCDAEEARRKFSSLLQAAETGKSTIITRRGRSIAALVPIDEFPRSLRQASLLPLAGSGRGLWGKDSQRTLRHLRGEWSNFR
jgi:prevent-host-death family protein